MSMVDSIAFYQEHEAVLNELLDELVEKMQPEADDIPAYTFATLVKVFDQDASKASTTAALAVMRLAALKRTAGGGA